MIGYSAGLSTGAAGCGNAAGRNMVMTLPKPMLVLALALLFQGMTAQASPPAVDQAEFCALLARLRAPPPGDAKAVAAARTEVEGFIAQHRGIDWTGPVGRVIFSETGKAAGEVEVCPSGWVGGLSPDGALDSDTWAEPETRLFNLWRAAKQGQTVELRAALLGIYDARPDFPAKIWVRARIVDISPAP
jgi:hypothetical protein